MCHHQLQIWLTDYSIDHKWFNIENCFQRAPTTVYTLTQNDSSLNNWEIFHIHLSQDRDHL